MVDTTGCGDAFSAGFLRAFRWGGPGGRRPCSAARRRRSSPRASEATTATSTWPPRTSSPRPRPDVAAVGNIRETGPSGDAPRVHFAVTCAVGRGLPASRGRATRAHREQGAVGRTRGNRPVASPPAPHPHTARSQTTKNDRGQRCCLPVRSLRTTKLLRCLSRVAVRLASASCFSLPAVGAKLSNPRPARESRFRNLRWKEGGNWSFSPRLTTYAG